MNTTKAAKLSPHGIGLALAILSAVGMLVMGLLALNGVHVSAWEAMMQWHMWADLTAVGILIGMLEAAICSYICGWLFGWLYNKVA